MAEYVQKKKLPRGGTLKGVMSVKCFDWSFSASFSSPLTQKIRSHLNCLSKSDRYGLGSSGFSEIFSAATVSACQRRPWNHLAVTRRCRYSSSLITSTFQTLTADLLEKKKIQLC